MKFSEELLRAVADLHIKPRRNAYTMLSGNYRSAFRGSGMQFKEFRHYEEGDDIRHMSWSVTARTGRATMKVYEEDRELNVVVAVDVSGSSLFGHGKKRKIDMYADLTALLGLATLKSNDNVGLLLFNDEPVFYLPPRRTRDHVQIAMGKLLEQKLRGQKSDIRPALEFMAGNLKSRSLIVILSDFLVPRFESELRMATRKHELLLAHCFDEAERGEGLSGVYEIRDPESGELFLLDSNSKKTRARLAQYQSALADSLRDSCRGARADYLPLSVEDDYLQTLVRYFRRRATPRQ